MYYKIEQHSRSFFYIDHM